MGFTLSAGLALVSIGVQAAAADAPSVPMSQVKTDRYPVTFARLGSNRVNGMLDEPAKLSSNSHVALLYSYPRPSVFNAPAAEKQSNIP